MLAPVFSAELTQRKSSYLLIYFSGVCAGIAGLIAVSSIRTSDANQVGLYYELDAILAVIIGGTMLTGGRFSLLASAIGALVIQATTTSSLSIGVPANALIAVKALVVIVVILLYSQQVRNFIRKFTSRPKPTEVKS